MQNPALRNVPTWWWQRLQKDYGDTVAARIVQASLQPGPLTLRVNAQHATPTEYIARYLQPAGIAAHVNGDYGVTLEQALPVQQLPGFEQGWVSVQDAAAQQAAGCLLQDVPADKPLRVLDACAAPGGKTAHVLELYPQHDVVALEVDAMRAERIHQNLQRIGAQAQVVVADAANTAAWWDGKPFDAILLDAPCTASGIMRRHPDVPWLRRADDVAQLAAQQRRLLDALWPLLKPGGHLLYCTCSVFKEEGEQQAALFAARHTNAKQLPALGHLLPVNTCQVSESRQNKQLYDHDGFFYARFIKQD